MSGKLLHCEAQFQVSLHKNKLRVLISLFIILIIMPTGTSQTDIKGHFV